MHDAPLRQVVRDRVMLGDAVVPERHIVYVPSPADRELGPRSMREQERQQRIALARTKLVNTGGKTIIDEQRFASRHRMRAHYRMRHRRMLGHRTLVAFLVGGIRTPTAGRKGL